MEPGYCSIRDEGLRACHLTRLGDRRVAAQRCKCRRGGGLWSDRQFWEEGGLEDAAVISGGQNRPVLGDFSAVALRRKRQRRYLKALEC